MSLLKICRTIKQVRRLIRYCKRTRYCSFDFETSGKFHAKDGHITIMGVSFQAGSAWVVPLFHYESPFTKRQALKILKMFEAEIFTNYDVVKVAWNFQFEYKWLMRYGIKLKGRLFDGMLAKYCLDEERPNGLKDMVARFFPKYAGYELAVKGREWGAIPLAELAPYCGVDADLTLRLMWMFEPKLIKNRFYNLFRNLLMMGSRVLAESEFQGMPIDRPYLMKMVDIYRVKIAEAEADMYRDKMVVKYNRRKQLANKEVMLEALSDEIAEIEKGDSKQKARMIAGRREKQAQIIAGTFTGKEGKLKAWENFNFRSPQQMGEFLFTKMGCNFNVIRYTVDKKTKRESKNASTDESVILELQAKYPDNTFLKRLLDYRGLEKLNGTYIEGMLQHLSDHNRVHGNFKIHGTVTGRLSCEKPNLQNIPRDNTASDIKPMFLPDPGFLLCEVDYGQAELRVAAEMADEDVMIDIFRKGYNIHLATALKVDHCLDRYDEIKKLLKDVNHPDQLMWERKKKKAKTINFGIIYGQGDEKLALGMGVPVEEAKEFKRGWFKAYPKLVKYMEYMQKFVQKNGYIVNMFGRKRRLPDGMFSDKWAAKRENMMGKFMEAMRQAVNAPIQGTASDFTFFSQVVIREMVNLGQLPAYLKQYYTVHDSIGYPLLPEDAHWVIPILIKICDNPYTQKYFGFQLKKVKMKVSPELGVNWGNLREWYPGMDAVEFDKSERKRLGLTK